MSDAVHAYDVLRGVLRRMHGESPDVQEKVELDALCIWSMVHGLAGVMNGQCIDKLGLKPKVLHKAVAHAMSRMRAVLATDL